jgi:hypothetical protein
MPPPVRKRGRHGPALSVNNSEPPGSADRRGADLWFEDVASRVGVTFRYDSGARGEFRLRETLGGGVGALDYDRDGRLDLFFVNAGSSESGSIDQRPGSRLFAAIDDGSFRPVEQPANARLPWHGHGVAVGDYDNDGYPDLFATGSERTVLLRNNGDGAFADRTREANALTKLWTTAAAFTDLNGDGHLDLWVCTYADAATGPAGGCVVNGKVHYCEPSLYEPLPDLLYINDGSGRFERAPPEAGLVNSPGHGLGIAIADFNGDVRPDVFVANDLNPNHLMLNRGEGRFQESAASLGAAYARDASTMAAMGVACGDVDLNGWPDLVVTDYYGRKTAAFRNLGKSGFVDDADAVQLGAPSLPMLGFGANFLDADLDGDLDLFIANGHVSDLSHLGTPHRMTQQLFENVRGERFVDVSRSAGPYSRERILGRGSAVADLDNDGRPDVIANPSDDPAAVLLNRCNRTGHWLGLELVGRRSNRDGRGAKVRVVANGHERGFEIVGGTGYLSTSDVRLLIRLGEAPPELVDVRWPGGTRQIVDPRPIGRYRTIVEPR